MVTSSDNTAITRTQHQVPSVVKLADIPRLVRQTRDEFLFGLLQCCREVPRLNQSDAHKFTEVAIRSGKRVVDDLLYSAAKFYNAYQKNCPQPQPSPEEIREAQEIGQLKSLSQEDRIKVILNDMAPQIVSSAIATTSLLFLTKTTGFTFAANLASTFAFGSIVKDSFKDVAKKAKAHSGQFGENIALAAVVATVLVTTLAVDKVILNFLY